jgi:hypothetical protein
MSSNGPKKITFKGQPLPIYSSKKVVLPQKSGKLKRAACIGIDVQLPSNRRDIFGRQLITEEIKRVSTGSKIRFQ